MEDKCSQMTLSEALAAEEQHSLGPQVPLLGSSSGWLPNPDEKPNI